MNTTTDHSNHAPDLPGFPPPGTDPAREVTSHPTHVIERHGCVPGTWPMSLSDGLGLDWSIPGSCPECVGWVAGVLFSAGTALGVRAVSVCRATEQRWSVHLHDRVNRLVPADVAARYVALLDPVRNPDSGHVVVEIADYFLGEASFTNWWVLLDLGTAPDGHHMRVQAAVYGGLRPDHPAWLPSTDDTVAEDTSSRGAGSGVQP